MNEARYAQNYVAWHAGRGQGPLRIALELRSRGVGEAEISAAVGAEEDWSGRAVRAARARFGPEPAQSLREKARRVAFLRYRGFSSDHIRAALGADPDTD